MIATTSRCELSSGFPPLQGQTPKEINAILEETLGEHAPSYATIKNWVAQFKRGDFSTCEASHPGRPKTATTPEIIDQIHKLILEDHRISAKSIAKQLGISCEWAGSIIHEDFDMRKLSAKWALAIQKKLAYLSFQYLDHPPYFRIWPPRTTTCSLD